MSELAPIAVFAYNRPDHLKKTLHALVQDPLASLSEIYIFSDGAKPGCSPEELKKIHNVRSIAGETHGFLKKTIKESTSNLGLANSIIRGVTEVIQQYGKIIVLEDDLVVKSGFLKFMNESLDSWKADAKVFSIAGYTPPFRYQPTPKTYLCHRFNSWGWGTWIDRWQSADWTVSSYPRFRCSFVQRLQFGQGGLDMPLMLDDQMSGKINSWAIRFAFSQFQNHAVTVFPTESFIQNIGFDDSGTHPNPVTAHAKVFCLHPIAIWIYYSAGLWTSLKLLAKLLLSQRVSK